MLELLFKVGPDSLALHHPDTDFIIRTFTVRNANFANSEMKSVEFTESQRNPSASSLKCMGTLHMMYKILRSQNTEASVYSFSNLGYVSFLVF
jgi:hypothetical protein